MYRVETNRTSWSSTANKYKLPKIQPSMSPELTVLRGKVHTELHSASSSSLPPAQGSRHEFIDADVKCRMCGAEFVFTAGEQQFFKTMGFTNTPKHCRHCRSKAKGGRARIDVIVACAECGAKTTVPFRPTQGRPVYCRDCFVKRKSAEG